VPDPIYVAARRVLLDALEAIRAHLDAIVLVGAQAVYLHAGEADLAVAPYTTDGDVAIDPRRIGPEPLIEEALGAVGFQLAEDAVGIWQLLTDVGGQRKTVAVDLLVPASLGGPGRRGARIPPHAIRAARKVVGLEGALVDRDLREVGALEADDDRRFKIAVSGPAGLIVAKVHKIAERTDDADRGSDKDALDVYRLLRAVPTDDLVSRFGTLRTDGTSRDVTEAAIELLRQLFGSPAATGCEMAVRAAGPLEPADVLSASIVALTQDLLNGL